MAAPAAAGRVALFLPNLGGGGAERITVNLARGLVEAGYGVDLVAASAEGTFADRLPAGVRLVGLGARRTATALLPLARYLRRERPAALLSALNHANVVAVLAGRLVRYRRPMWVAEHSEMLPRDWRTPGQRAFLALLAWAYARATGVIAVSHGVRRSLQRVAGVPEARVRVIYNPVVFPELFEQAKALPDHPFLREPGPPVVLGIGRLTRAKNFAHLLRAIAALAGRVDVRALILGEGEDRAALTELVNELGLGDRVALPGFVANPFAYLAHADLFVLSSDWEGLPGVLIEALAVGTPVVSTDCPSGPREILNDGAYGELVPVGDVDALAAAIERALAAGRRATDPAWLEQFTVGDATRRYAETLGLAPVPTGGAAPAGGASPAGSPAPLGGRVPLGGGAHGPRDGG